METQAKTKLRLVILNAVIPIELMVLEALNACIILFGNACKRTKPIIPIKAEYKPLNLMQSFILLYCLHPRLYATMDNKAVFKPNAAIDTKVYSLK